MLPEQMAAVGVPECGVCHEEYQSRGDKAPLTLTACGHSVCSQCARELIRHHPHGRRAARCPTCRVDTTEDAVRPTYLARECVATLQALAMGSSVLSTIKTWALWLVGWLVLTLVWVSTPLVAVVVFVSVWVRDLLLATFTDLMGIRVPPIRLPAGTSLSPSQYVALINMFYGDIKLESIYRSSRDGSTYGNLLDRVGDKLLLVFIIRKGRYVFGAFISGGLELPENPTDCNEYDCDVWWFSLAGHFWRPTKIDIPQQKQRVIRWRERRGLPAVRSCLQAIDSSDVPAGYWGKWTGYGDACLGGRDGFVADEVEVLAVQ
ncbi:unnamed protein product [Vitrella brassicaformis CCMP3155]|uniref:RING-type domain-containing protein n=2 Tax=Vitrella brassicaformis TaxID=1169539 RepID=A0A0G4GTI3_VITBC|nr:unnamed protein product [Vitrella brassicaformis CCMP3155]|eukprot:CEM34082.1 unnamed protein product [Vitrella brassicaformis CCMP3155]